MIDSLITGEIFSTPTQRTGQSGKTFVTAKMRAAAGGGEAFFVNTITFNTTTGAALLALGEGDSVALSVSLTPKVWTDRDGVAKPAIDLVAHQCLTPYHVTRRRQAAARPDDGHE